MRRALVSLFLSFSSPLSFEGFGTNCCSSPGPVHRPGPTLVISSASHGSRRNWGERERGRDIDRRIGSMRRELAASLAKAKRALRRETGRAAI